jgi:AAA domain, putative AbiEii toxin, Type IV TA system/AAA domain
MYISRIRLENIRGFPELEIDFSGNEGPLRRTLIIGKNGTCKTSVLRAIALGLCDSGDANALISEPIGAMIHKDSRVAQIRIDLEGEQRLHSFLVQNPATGQERISRAPRLEWPEIFVCGYGAGRHGFGPEAGRDYRVADAVYTLFDYRRTLVDPELTLRRLKDLLGTRRYGAAVAGIRRVLGLTSEDEIRLPAGGGVELVGPTFGGSVRLEGWADGYRMTFNWMIDLYGRALRADRITPEGHVRGIVLIDEIEQHLHPSMQAEILPRITEVFPEIQLIATTHSPLIALDARPDELVVLRREGSEVVRQEAVPDFTGYSAEDMLADERLFDTEIYSPEMREKVGRYRELAAIRPCSGSDGSAVGG